MRCAIYARVSTEEQAKHGYSLAAQIHVCKNKAREMGAGEIHIFRDEGTGSILDRPGLSALRGLIREGAIDVLIVYDPDRLHRKLVNQLIITEEIEKKGVMIEFINFEWKNTSEGRLFYQIRGAISEYEREKIRERMSFGKAQKARQGKIPLGFDCLGYNYEKGTGNVTINENEAATVRLIYDMFANSCYSINEIARYLNESGVPTKRRRGIWHRQVVRQVLLKNKAYTGKWYYGKSKILINIPPIIDEYIAVIAAERLDQARRLWAGKGRKNYLLSGIVSCGDCGNTMCGAAVSRRGRHERKYTCRKAFTGCKSPGCRPVKRIAAEEIENVVWGVASNRIKNPAAIVEQIDLTAIGGSVSGELKITLNHLQEIQRGRVNLINTLAAGLACNCDTVYAQLAFLMKRQDKLLAKKEKLERSLPLIEKEHPRDELMSLAENIIGAIDDLDYEEKKTLLRALVKQVVVTGHGNDLLITVHIR